MRSIINIATAVCILGVGTTLRAASPQYMITGLGSLGGASSAQAVNNAGQVVGVSYLGDGSYHAFLWQQASGMVDLGVLPGGAPSSATRINDLGQVVGTSGLAGQNSPRGFTWNAQTGMSQVGVGLSAEPMAVNNLGQIAGYASADGFLQSNFGFVYSPQGGLSSVSVSGVTTYGVEAMDDKGDMVVFGPQSSTSLFVAPGQEPIEISGGGLTEATAVAMNASGVVVGSASSSPNGDAHAFVWSESTGMVDITPVPGGDAFAQAINSNGDVVGFEMLGAGETLSFLYRDGTTYDLTGSAAGQLGRWMELAGAQRGLMILGMSSAAGRSMAKPRRCL